MTGHTTIADGVIMDRPKIGHNNPPSPISPDLIRINLIDSHASLAHRRDELVRTAAAFVERHPTIESEDVAAAAVQNLDMISKHRRRVEDARKDAKEPFLLGGRVVDGWFKEIDRDLEQALAWLGKPATAYAAKVAAERRAAAQAEADRLRAEAERAEQQAHDSGNYAPAIEKAQAAEAADQLAHAKPAELSRITGTYGSVGSLSESLDFEIEDPAVIPHRYMVPDRVAIRRAITQGVRKIPGVRIYPVQKLRTR